MGLGVKTIRRASRIREMVTFKINKRGVRHPLFYWQQLVRTSLIRKRRLAVFFFCFLFGSMLRVGKGLHLVFFCFCFKCRSVSEIIAM